MIELRTLGTLDLRTRAGLELRSVLAQPKRFALLIYLAVAQPRGFHRRDRIVALFWPESDEERARGALRQALSFLRRSLGDEVIRTRGEEEIAVEQRALWCDAVAFEELAAAEPAEALALYRGDFLQGVHVEGAASELDDWLDAQRTRLRTLAAQAAWRLAEVHEAAGDVAEAASWVREALRFAPQDEVQLRRALAVLHRMGDRVSAVRLYEEFARRLAAEYELQPAPETQALVAEYRAATPGRAATATAPITQSSEPSLQAAASHRKWLPVVALVIALAVIVAVIRSDRRAPEDGSVAVALFENRTGDPRLDPLGVMAADWITQGLAQTGLVQVVAPRAVELRKAAQPSILVVGSYYTSNDTLHWQTRITDAASGKVLRALDRVSGPTSTSVTTLDAVRQRVTAGLASLLDPKLASWAAAAAVPPSFAAYREHAEGMESFIGLRFPEAIEHFTKAAALDSAFVTPALMAGVAYINVGAFARADSIVRELSARREQLAPIDRGLLDWVTARCRGDWSAALAASRRNALLTPGSSFFYVVAYDALALNQPTIAIAALEPLDPQRGFLHGWYRYWDVLTSAYHATGDYDRELVRARAGRQQYPTQIAMLRNEARALAALGRVSQVEQLLSTALALPQPSVSPGRVLEETALELRAHGHDDAATRVLQRAVTWYRSRPESEADMFGLAVTLFLARRWSESAEILRTLTAAHPQEIDYHGLYGTLQARLGNRSAAQRISQQLGQRNDSYLFGENYAWQARIAAELGDRAGAIRLLREAFARGQPYTLQWHRDPHFGTLQTEPEFRALIMAQR